MAESPEQHLPVAATTRLTDVIPEERLESYTIVRTASDLEDALLDRLQDFLLEMGHGFCFEARQKRLLIGDEHFFVDLVFYHRVLKCHVLVELKTTAFTHEHDFHRQQVAALTPIVQNLIRSQSRSAQEIERTLDRLLDCACIPEGLALFKALCRYYYAIDPAATASYVHTYRDMWDSEEPEAEARRA